MKRLLEFLKDPEISKKKLESIGFRLDKKGPLYSIKLNGETVEETMNFKDYTITTDGSNSVMKIPDERKAYFLNNLAEF